jgi:gamma-glutamyltranspeptidase/glutathione hydrolase
MVLLATLNFLNGASAAEIVSEPRIHHQYVPDVLQFEPNALTQAEQAGLAARGHTLRAIEQPWGNMQAIVWDYASGSVEAASDPRGAVAELLY